MKRVVQLKILASERNAALVIGTPEACNAAANRVSAVARERNIRSGYDLRGVTYGDVKATVPGAQAAQQTIRKVVQAYRTHRANLHAGNYGKRGSERRERAERRVLRFRPGSAQPHDDRILSWDHEARTVSIWVMDRGDGKPGRLRDLAFTGREEDVAAVIKFRHGETDLVYRGGELYLIPTLELPDPDAYPPQDWLGVDLGESRRGESHPPALAEPGVNLSAHRAPIVQPSGRTPQRQ